MRGAGIIVLLMVGLLTTAAVPVAADYLTAVAAMSLPEAVVAVSIGFTGDEVYDCDDDIDHTVNVDMSNLDSVCTSPLQLDYDWVDCHQIFNTNN